MQYCAINPATGFEALMLLLMMMMMMMIAPLIRFNQSVEKKVPVELTIVENRKSYSRWHEIMATGKYVFDGCGLALAAPNALTRVGVLLDPHLSLQA